MASAQTNYFRMEMYAAQERCRELERRVTALGDGLREALPYVEATHAGSGPAARLRDLLEGK